MGTARRKIYSGHTIPYGVLANTSKELRQAYYGYGYKEDYMLPELPIGSVYDSEEPPPTPDEAVTHNEMHRMVAELINTLKPREAMVLRMRFGIGTASDMTVEEISRALDVTCTRIRQILASALRRLKQRSRSDRLRLLKRDLP